MGGACSSSRDSYVHSANDVSVKDFSIYQTIGHGEFGKVFLGVHHGTRKLVAVKQIDLSRIWESGMKTTMIHNELNALRIIGTHPFITELAFSTLEQGMCYVALSLASGGCLRDHMAAMQFCEISVAFIVACMDSALCYMHARGVLHRDIKPANIVLDQYGYPCLVDFGISYISNHEDMVANRPLSCRMTSGTEAYCAPELLTASHEHGIESEYWSLGIMVFEMIFGRRPFRRKVPKAFVKYIQKRRDQRQLQAEVSIRTLGTYDSAASMSYSEKNSTRLSSVRTTNVIRGNRQGSWTRPIEKARVELEREDSMTEGKPEVIGRGPPCVEKEGEVITASAHSQPLCSEQQQENDMGVAIVEYFPTDQEDDEEELQQCTVQIPAVTSLNVPVSPDLESFLRGVLDVRVQCRLGGSEQPVRGHPWVDSMQFPKTEMLERRTARPPALLTQAAYKYSQTNILTPIETCKQQLEPASKKSASSLMCCCIASMATGPISPRIRKIHSEIGEYNYVSRKFRKARKNIQ